MITAFFGTQAMRGGGYLNKVTRLLAFDLLSGNLLRAVAEGLP